MNKTPGDGPGVSVHGSELEDPTTTRNNRKVLSLADARRRKAERERQAQPSKLVRDAFAAFQPKDGDPPKGAA